LDDTATLTQDVASARRGQASPKPALVIVWSAESARRVGEVAIVRGSEPLLLGRGVDRPDDPAPRLTWMRQRPGRSIDTEPLADRRLSRRQLQITARGKGVDVELLGRGSLEKNGVEAGNAVSAEPGDVLGVGGVLSLLVTSRPPVLPAARSLTGRPHRFGAADGDGLVGESAAAWAFRDRVAFVAGRQRHVLITGASGTGKELAARAIHRGSPRSSKAFVARNAATVPEGLFDAELFGNARNYPNPGTPARTGLVGEADGGTLFLDEIGELPDALQAHLLRVLDGDGEYQRLGEDRRRSSDLRLVAATNRDPESLKHDFLARLPLRLTTPSLADRPEDVPLLLRSLARALADEDPELAARYLEDGEPRLDRALVERLVRHPWTTHVRELDTLLWLSIGSSPDDVLELTPDVAAALGAESPDAASVDPRALTRDDIVAALERCGGVQERAWRDLGLRSRFALARLVKKHGIDLAATRGG